LKKFLGKNRDTIFPEFGRYIDAEKVLIKELKKVLRVEDIVGITGKNYIWLYHKENFLQNFRQDVSISSDGIKNTKVALFCHILLLLFLCFVIANFPI